MMHTHYSNTSDCPARGVLAADASGRYNLKWDSAYGDGEWRLGRGGLRCNGLLVCCAMLTCAAVGAGEAVTRQVRVVRGEEFEAAQEACREAHRELRRYEKQRAALRETLW